MQASRKPRRAFAVPLVMTVAAMPACIVESKPAQPTTGGTTTRDNRDNRTPAPRHENPPRPTEPTTDPTPIDPVPAQTEAPAYHRNWTVTMQKDGTCEAYMAVECKKGATCNPPPPQPIECPSGITAARPVDIFASAGSWDCYIKPPESKCPEKATCNPPPPRKTACPQ
jgi:hypothetical protein